MPVEASWRASRPVLVVDAHTLGAIAVIRSLGRAGYPVHACATAGEASSALGLRSSFAAARAVCPDHDSAALVPWLRRYLAQHRIAAIVPSEAFLLAVRDHFAALALGPLLPHGHPESTLYTGLSKHDVLATLETAAEGHPARAHLPPSLRVDLDADADAGAIAALGAGPYYVKVDGCHSLGGEPGRVHPEPTAREAAARLTQLAGRYRRALVQAHVPGCGVGAFFLLRQGRVMAELMHRRLHEVPHTGGMSSLRETWFDAAIRDDALAKLRHLGWDGVAMMEYRHEPSGAFHLMELNGRFWGSLHLALWAGVDFPRLTLDTHFGREEPPPRARLGVKVRHTVPAEIQHVWSRLRDPQVRPLGKLASLADLALRALDPRVRSDLLFPGDRALYLRGLRDFAGTLLRARPWRRPAGTEGKAGAVHALKRGVYRLARRTGLFHLSRRLTRRSVRVLCYHGTSMRDESRFDPQLFIDPAIFERRLQYLRDHRFPVVSLERAVDGLARGDLPDNATVITIDDGFFSTYRHAARTLLAEGVPATVYVTSYYCQQRTPVFRLAVQYLFWAKRARELDLEQLGHGFSGRARLDTPAETEAAMWRVVAGGEALPAEEQRADLARRLGEALGADYEALVHERRVSLMTSAEIRELAERGMDIQLHTHRHRLPLDEAGTRREIEQNRAFLEPLVGRRLEHFCYPGGRWDERHFEWLTRLGIRSATTTDLGHAYPGSNPLLLQRFLDGADISSVEFEAELYGFSELLRRLRALLRRLPGSGRRPAAGGPGRSVGPTP